jgi:hypothetical protein
LRKLFKYSKVIKNFYNDTPESYRFNNSVIETNAKTHIESIEIEDSLIIPNVDYYNCSNNSIYELEDDIMLLRNIENQFGRLHEDYGMFQCIKFLDYHYKHSSTKKIFLKFVKEKFLTLDWVKKTKNDKFEIYYELINWIEKKEKKKKKRFFISLQITLGVVMIILAIREHEVKLIISALLGSSLVLLGKLVEKYF